MLPRSVRGSNFLVKGIPVENNKMSTGARHFFSFSVSDNSLFRSKINFTGNIIEGNRNAFLFMVLYVTLYDVCTTKTLVHNK